LRAATAAISTVMPLATWIEQAASFPGRAGGPATIARSVTQTQNGLAPAAQTLKSSRNLSEPPLGWTKLESTLATRSNR